MTRRGTYEIIRLGNLPLRACYEWAGNLYRRHVPAMYLSKGIPLRCFREGTPHTKHHPEGLHVGVVLELDPFESKGWIRGTLFGAKTNVPLPDDRSEMIFAGRKTNASWRMTVSTLERVPPEIAYAIRSARHVVIGNQAFTLSDVEVKPRYGEDGYHVVGLDFDLAVGWQLD